MRLESNKRISLQQAKSTVLVAFILGLLFTTFQLFLDFKNEQEAYNTTIHQMLSTLEHPATQAVYDLDKVGAEQIVKGMLIFEPIVAADIKDELGEILARKERSLKRNIWDSMLSLFIQQTKIYTLALTDNKTGEQMGSLVTTVNIHVIARNFINRAIIIIFSGLLRNFVLALVLLVLFYRSLTKPLLVIINAFSKIKPGAENHDPFPVPEKHKEDELGTMVRTFEGILTQYNENLQQRRDAEKKYRNIFENSMEGIFQISRVGRFISVNPSLLKFLGYESLNDLELRVNNLQNQLFVDKIDFKQLLNQLLKKGFVIGMEIRLHPKNRQIIWVSLSCQAIRNKQNRIEHFEGTMVDITLRKLAELEATQLRNYLKNVIDSMPSILLSVDSLGSITQWNPEAEHMTGVPISQAIGRSLVSVYPHFASIAEKINEAILQHKIQRDEKVTLSINGNKIHLDVLIYPLVTNSINGAVVRMDDITERIHLEQMMIQTEKMMSVGGLAAGMAHEINNPLGIIVQGAQNVIRRFSPSFEKNKKIADELNLNLETTQAYLERRDIMIILESIKRSGLRASKIVNNTLAFSRKSEGKMSLVNVHNLINTTIDLANKDYDLKKHYDFRSIEIVKQLDPFVQTINCIETEIEQVLLNLFKNAAHAMGEGDVSKSGMIIIKTIKESDWIKLEVEDNGPGMTEETSRRLFEPFYTTKPVGVGTGLGLSVVFTIITNNHKGFISVNSKLGEGTSFSIRLPINQ